MTQPKIVESDTHQIIGDIKIQEICKQYFSEINNL